MGEKTDIREKRKNHFQICQPCQSLKNCREKKKLKTKKTNRLNVVKKMGWTRIIKINLKRGNLSNKRNQNQLVKIQLKRRNQNQLVKIQLKKNWRQFLKSKMLNWKGKKICEKFLRKNQKSILICLFMTKKKRKERPRNGKQKCPGYFLTWTSNSSLLLISRPHTWQKRALQ